MHSGGVLTVRILERNCAGAPAAGTCIWKCFSPTVWIMPLNAIMLISEISLMAIKDCYIELDFLKLDYGCYFTLVFVNGCTHTVCWNVVVVYWWGSFPLLAIQYLERNWSTPSRFAKLKPKYPTAIVYGHILHSVTVCNFFFHCFILLLYPFATCVHSLPPAHLCS